MKIEGKVAQIIYKNDMNAWTVLLIKVGNKYETAVGDTTDDIELDDLLEFDGEYITHKTYGYQFKFNSYIKSMPKDEITLISYISDNVHGIGKKTAKNIVNEFAENTIDVIRYTPSKLEGIKGLNQEKIFALSEFFNEEWEKWNVIKFLAGFNISTVTANKIFTVLGKDTIDFVKENPYSLLEFVKTLEFKTIDELAKNLGIDKNSYTRVDAGVMHVLSKITEFGHTCARKEDLIKETIKVLEVLEEDIEASIVRLKMSEKIYMFLMNDEEYITKRSFYIAEKNIAMYISKKSKEEISKKEYSKEIEEASKRNSLVLSDEQKNAIKVALNSNMSIITGGPGTGKTTIIKCIIDILENEDIKYLLAAPTGRAVKRISETTKKSAKTLHRLLEITKVDDRDLDKMINIDVKYVEAKYLIIDEASMIDTIMMNNLVRALKKETKVILVGDVDQLPSVGGGTVLKDLIDSKVVPTIYLNTIYRQSSKSDIIVNAHKVNTGEHFEFKNKDTDMFFIPSKNTIDALEQIESLVKYRLKKFANIDMMRDMQILCPTKKTELGVIALNKMIQDSLNPKADNKKEKSFGEKIFRVGDKVMQIVNNYDKKFSLNGEFFEGVYNGDVGFVKEIDHVEEKLIVVYDDTKEVVYDFNEIDELEHAYAITVHKSQGSEFDYVILPLLVGYQKLFTRNLLYTAMTRAKKMLIVVGKKELVDYMIDNIDEKNRLTGLKHQILNEI